MSIDKGHATDWLRCGLLALLAGLVVWNLATLGRTPGFVSEDDGAYASASLQFWRTGRPGVPGYAGNLLLERDVWSLGRVAAAIQGIFLRAFGVNVFLALLPSFLAGCALLLVTFQLGRTLFGRDAGLLGAVLLAASGVFFLASHAARPDILLSLFVVGALAVTASSRGLSTTARAFYAGLLVALGLHVHLNALVFVPVVFVFWVSLERPSLTTVGRFAGVYLSLVLAGSALWVLLHYTPDPALFTRQVTLFGGKDVLERAASSGLASLFLREADRYVDWFLRSGRYSHLVEALAITVAFYWAIRKGGRPGRALFLCWATEFMLASLVMNPWRWYLIYVWPLFSLAIAGAATSRHSRRLAGGLLAGLVLLVAVAQLMWWDVLARRGGPLSVLFPEVRAAIPASARVLGNGALWFAFHDRSFSDSLLLQSQCVLGPPVVCGDPSGTESIDTWMKARWDYVVATGALRECLDPLVSLDEVLRKRHLGGPYAFARELRALSLEASQVRRFGSGAFQVLVLKVVHMSSGSLASGSGPRPYRLRSVVRGLESADMTGQRRQSHL